MIVAASRVDAATARIEHLFRLFSALLPLPGINITLHLVDDEHAESALDVWATTQIAGGVRLAKQEGKDDGVRWFTVYRPDGSELATVLEDLS